MNKNNHRKVTKKERMKTMSKKRIVSILLVFILILVSNNANMMKTSAAMKPKIKRVSLVSSTTVSVVWNKVPKAKSYEVYCSRGSGVFKKVKTVKSTNYTFKNLDLGTEYSYKVKAIVKGKKSGFSNTKKIKTNNWAYLLDVAKPYNKPEGYSEGKFKVAGKNYYHGFMLQGPCETYFNLSAKYSKISFDAGLIEYGGEKEMEIYVYIDDSEMGVVESKSNDLAKHYEININYGSKLMIKSSERENLSYNQPLYGLGNIKVYK